MGHSGEGWIGLKVATRWWNCIAAAQHAWAKVPPSKIPLLSFLFQLPLSSIEEKWEKKACTGTHTIIYTKTSHQPWKRGTHIHSHEQSSKALSQVSKKILGKILGKQNLFKVQHQNKAVSYSVSHFPWCLLCCCLLCCGWGNIKNSDLRQSYLETFKSPSFPKIKGSIVKCWWSDWNWMKLALFVIGSKHREDNMVDTWSTLGAM